MPNENKLSKVQRAACIILLEDGAARQVRRRGTCGRWFTDTERVILAHTVVSLCERQLAKLIFESGRRRYHVAVLTELGTLVARQLKQLEALPTTEGASAAPAIETSEEVVEP